MNQFSISDLSRYSGIKAHTIRIWESRYNALKPERTEGNTRRYDNNDLRRLLNIVSLSSTGYSVSELAGFPDKKLFSLVADSMQKKDEASEYFITQLIAAGMDFDEQHFTSVFSHCLLRFGLNSTYEKVIYPMLNRIGLMWSGDDIPPANEHFISNLIRQKISTAIDSYQPPPANAETWVLFLPEDELHETGLLMAHHTLRAAGKKSVYLGGNVPNESLVSALQFIKPAKVLFFLVHNNIPEDIKAYLKSLTKHFPGVVYVAGKEEMLVEIPPQKNVICLHHFEDLSKNLVV